MDIKICFVLRKSFPLFFIVIFTFSCAVRNKVFDVEVGDVPQDVEEVFIENPDGIEVEVWQQNLEVPWSIVFLPDGNALVSERPGRIRIIQNGKLQDEPYASIANVFTEGSESGLLGLALHPDFENKPYVYAMFTHIDGNQRKDNKIIRFSHKGNSSEMDRVILEGIPAGDKHNGGRIKFGPDGMLYITTGENFDKEQAQDMETLAGKILRVTPEGDIPADNPFDGSYIFTLGHRNPQGIDWHPVTGDLFSSEHGPSGEMALFGKDYINIIYAGKNYGWPKVLGEVNREAYEDPVIFWEETTPPGGIAFWDEDLFVSTMSSETLIRISMEQNGNSYIFTAMEHWFAPSRSKGIYGRFRDAAVGPDGALYVLTTNRDGRGNPVEEDDRILRITKVERE